MIIYVGNIAYSMNEDELAQVFESFGAVVSAKVIRFKDSGKSKGYGFVEMENNDEAEAAIEAVNGSEIGGRTLRVSEANAREERDDNSRREPRKRYQNNDNRSRSGSNNNNYRNAKPKRPRKQYDDDEDE